MEEHESFDGFSLLGGPLHKLGTRLGLVRDRTNTLPVGLVLGPFLWAVLMALAVIEDLTHELFTLAVLGAHLRLLVVIPLFFLCESFLAPQARAFVSLLVSSGVVPRKEVPALESAVETTTRWKDSWLAEAFCLLVAISLPWISAQLEVAGVPRVPALSHGASHENMTNWWFWVVCLPLFRFLLVRWLWRLGLWSFFLWRVARMELELVPTHPDGVAGLGYLEVVHTHFTPLILALSIVPAAMVADGIAKGAMTIEAMTPSIVWILALDAVLFVGPLFLFAPRLWNCREKGLRDYMELAAHYVTAFDRKWLGPGAPPEEPFLGTPDVQSLADISGAISVVRTMRWAPVSLRLFGTFLGTAILPILPLLLVQYPVGDLAQRLFTGLIGL